ncbi:MAG: hypothetical protein ACYTG0_07810, partial [Planctomycetota bacterium]
MLGKTSHLGLSHRVVAYYLMFALAAVAWLGIGAVVVAKSVLESQSETEALNRLSEAANAARTASLHEEIDLQGLVERLRSKWGLAYCAVVSNDGVYLAHSSPTRVGRRHRAPAGEVARWGDVQRIRYVDSQSRLVREYETSIERRGRTWATLLMAAPAPGVWGILPAAARHAPAALVCPMLLMIIGAFALRRTVRPATAIEGQLKRAAARPSISEDDFHPVHIPTPVGIGWDRLVESLRNGGRQAGFDTRLSQALEGYRE